MDLVALELNYEFGADCQTSIRNGRLGVVARQGLNALSVYCPVHGASGDVEQLAQFSDSVTPVGVQLHQVLLFRQPEFRLLPL